MISIDPSVLIGYYNAKAGILNGSSTSGALGSSSSAPKAPRPPWDASNAKSLPSALATKALQGHSVIDPNAAKLDLQGASEDYKSLFTLYQGLNALEGLTAQMLSKTATTGAKDLAAKAFNTGLGQVNTYVNSLKLQNMRLTLGTVASSEATTSGPAAENDTYTTGVVFRGAMTDAVPAFQGDVQFSIDVTKYTGTQLSVPIDLSQMGAPPRTMPNVVSFINDQLKAAGVATRFATSRQPGAPQTIKVGAQTVTLPAGPDQWSFKINGDSAEKVSFSAPATAAAVYVAQTSGDAVGYASQKEAAASAKALTAQTGLPARPAATDITAPFQQLIKLQAADSSTGSPPPAAAALPGTTNAAAGEVFAKAFDPDVSSVKASATGADGSLYLLANITGAVDGQSIQGSQDVALQKYDSAGNLVYTRTLGAANSATGLSLAVSADGHVAVAGAFTGSLDPVNTGNGSDTSDSFATLYDAQGQEVWTRTGLAPSNNQVNGVAIGADNSVYVAGQTNLTTALSSSAGSPQGYIGGYSSTGQSLFNLKVGATAPSAVAVDGSTLVVAGVNAGDAVLSSYALAATGAPTLNATRDLGALQGTIAGLAINSGQVVLAGTTRNAALSAGTVTAPASGGQDAFAAQFSEDLAAGPGDAIAYFGGAGNDSATAVTVSNGKVYIAGASAGSLPGLPTLGKQEGYVAQIDIGSGTVGWSQAWQGQEGFAAPEAIAVAGGGASVLDRLGLPTQTLQYTDSQLLTASSSLRAGDKFLIRTSAGATPATVTIEATDTPDTLAQKIERATGFTVNASVLARGGGEQVVIKPQNSRQMIELLPGPDGADALGALGLTPGVIQTAPAIASSSSSSSTSSASAPKPKNTYGLNIAKAFDLTTTDGITAAQTAIKTAIAKVQTAYYDLSNANKPKTPALTGTVPAYLTNEIASYQAALSRLTGGSSDSNSSFSSLFTA